MLLFRDNKKMHPKSVLGAFINILSIIKSQILGLQL